jgi:hypothetical protein
MRRPKRVTALFLALYTGAVAFAPSLVLADDLGEALAASVRLKQAHVVRSYEKCRSGGTSDASCRAELEALHPREVSALARIANSMAGIDATKPSEAMAGCYDPSHDYRDLIECWEQLAIQLEDGQEIGSTTLQVIPENDWSRDIISLDPVKRRSLLLCVRGTISVDFQETVADNLLPGGDDFAWALKVQAWENHLMVEIAMAADWFEMQEYYGQEALISQKLIRGEIGTSEYRQLAKRNEVRLAATLSPEMSQQSIHARNFTELKALCDEVAFSIIGRAKTAASE